ncbi:hypothetical protein DFH09DRAFT_1083947 [Mycena vulgaris]|nr:hypothetical protein DFH09DRAFT_1083947 [Mycena vulgaris]
MLIPLDKLGTFNNPICTCACGAFYCAATDPTGPVAHPGVKCGICGCFAGQHMRFELRLSRPPGQKYPAPSGRSPSNARRVSKSQYRQSQVEGDLNPDKSKAKKRKRKGEKLAAEAKLPREAKSPRVATTDKRAEATYATALVEGRRGVLHGGEGYSGTVSPFMRGPGWRAGDVYSEPGLFSHWPSTYLNLWLLWEREFWMVFGEGSFPRLGDF